MKPVSVARLILSALCLISVTATAQEATLKTLQEQWAIANYQLEGKAKKAAFETLIDRADAAVEANGTSAEMYIWRAIISSTFAGVKGGLGALKYAKSAKADLEHAMSIDDRALQGAAYTSLGTLYFKVPGWPIGFGDKAKAESLLKKALAINPDGIDPNYFYGEFLRGEKSYAQAKHYLLLAAKAPDRPGRALADKGRRQEINEALSDIENRL